MNVPTTEQATRGAARPGVPDPLWARARARLAHGDVGPLAVVVGLALIWIFFQSQNANFLTGRNLSNLILQIGVVGTLGIGVVLILLLGEIDLSIAAVAGVCASVLGVTLARGQWTAATAIGLTLLVGAAIGAVQGSWTVFVGVPSFIVTLAGLLAWQGVQLILLGDVGELPIQDDTIKGIASTYLSPAAGWALAAILIAAYALTLWVGWSSRRRAGLETPAVRSLIARLVVVAGVSVITAAVLNSYFGVPYVLVILLALTVALTIVTSRTAFGRHIYAIGGNAEAARRAGINVVAVRIAVFTIASTLAALGGIIAASREFAVSTGTGGGTLLLDAIAAAVIGGTSLFGGRGQIYNALLGALVIGSVENGLDLLGQPASTQNIATGVILLLAVSIDAVSRRRRHATGA